MVRTPACLRTGQVAPLHVRAHLRLRARARRCPRANASMYVSDFALAKLCKNADACVRVRSYERFVGGYRKGDGVDGGLGISTWHEGRAESRNRLERVRGEGITGCEACSGSTVMGKKMRAWPGSVISKSRKLTRKGRCRSKVRRTGVRVQDVRRPVGKGRDVEVLIRAVVLGRMALAERSAELAAHLELHRLHQNNHLNAKRPQLAAVPELVQESWDAEGTGEFLQPWHVDYEQDALLHAHACATLFHGVGARVSDRTALNKPQFPGL
eukprot:5794842-Pleurochrysis_carterae.AAC.2